MPKQKNQWQDVVFGMSTRRRPQTTVRQRRQVHEVKRARMDDSHDETDDDGTWDVTR